LDICRQLLPRLTAWRPVSVEMLSFHTAPFQRSHRMYKYKD
jgi:hypothetical protein